MAKKRPGRDNRRKAEQAMKAADRQIDLAAGLLDIFYNGDLDPGDLINAVKEGRKDIDLGNYPKVVAALITALLVAQQSKGLWDDIRHTI